MMKSSWIINLVLLEGKKIELSTRIVTTLFNSVFYLGIPVPGLKISFSYKNAFF